VKASVAREALARGASLVNDVSALTCDPEMAAVCAEAGAPVVLMHRRGSARNMQELATYDDVVTETIRFLEERMEFAIRSGIPERRILVDPGIGFAKTAEQSLEILRRLPEYHALGRPVLLGASRKSFLSRFSEEGSGSRLEGTLAVSVVAILAGVSILRVHDVLENVRAARVTEAIRGAHGAEMRKGRERPC
jgi:dihydropteroate synthase